MANRQIPSMLLSFIDLLLSALGGVALLVFVFAAMQRNGNSRPVSSPNVLVIHVDNGLRIGREIGVELADDMDSVEIFSDIEEATALKVRWEPVANATYQATVIYDPKRGLRLTAWLRGIDPTLPDVHSLQGEKDGTFRAYLDTVNQPFVVVAYWLDKPEERWTIKIGPDTMYCGAVPLAR